MILQKHAIVFLLATLVGKSMPDEDALEMLMAKMEADTIAFAKEVERAYQTRCSEALNECSANNYDSCVSSLPNAMCPSSDQLSSIPECSNGARCGGLYDFTASVLRLPEEIADGVDGNPTDPMVIETVCYTRQLDDYIQKMYFSDKDFWAQYGIEPPAMHFGALDGTFRIFPGRGIKTCGSYDTRLRPWYVAGSSGPKDVLLVLDTSGSMSGITLDLLKNGAKRIINTLTVGDRISIVRFSDKAEVVGREKTMIPVTEDNKEMLRRAVDSFKATGATNFYDAFNLVFKTLEDTIKIEHHTRCNAAIIFFTDGEMSAPEWLTTQEDGGESEIIRLVSDRKAIIEEKIKRPLTLFTYSLGVNEVHALPRRMACATEGLWTKIGDPEEITKKLSSYFKAFAFGLGDGKNDDFVAWVEPYEFETGSNMGTTVSAPVYDRSVKPPVFLGVVGIDFLLSAMDQALGVEKGSTETLNAVVRKSTAHCPELSFAGNICQLESLRRQAGDEEALCTKNCTGEFVDIEPKQCTGVSDYPSNLWKNAYNKFKNYEERVCCMFGLKHPSDQCTASGPAAKSSAQGSSHLSGGAIAGIVALCALALCFCGICIPTTLRNTPPRQGQKKPIETEMSHKHHAGQASNSLSEVTVLPPPTAPRYIAESCG